MQKMQKTVLLVEREIDLARKWREMLEEDLETKCKIVGSLTEAEQVLEKKQFDLLMIRHNLADNSLIELMKSYRSELAETRVLVLSQRSLSSGEKEKLLSAGASDCLGQPYVKGEVLARARNLLEWRKIGKEGRYVLDNGLWYAPENGILYFDDKTVSLSKADNQLLEYLYCHRGEVVSWETIEHLKAGGIKNGERVRANIMMQVYRIRKKMGKYGNNLRSFHNYGYLLMIDNHRLRLRH